MQLQLDSGTEAELVHSEGASRGLVIIPDIWGLRPLFSEMCSSVAERTGWSTAAFEPFPGLSLPGSDDPEAMTHRGAALAGLKDADLLGDAMDLADRLGTADCALIGFCMGGMYALKAAATHRFDRIVSFYGMAHVPEAWRGAGQGDPVEALGRRGDVKVMTIVGTDDVFIPEADILDLEAAGVNVRRYEGAQHGFVHDPSRPVHRSDYAADAWPRALTFLAGS